MIHMNNVTKVYPNGSTGVENINLHINKGEFVFIVGSSGSGKSTLMKLLLKELDPTEGDIIINKVKTNELNRRQIPYLRRNLGVVFQDFRLLPNKTVYENVAFAMRDRGTRTHYPQKRACRAFSGWAGTEGQKLSQSAFRWGAAENGTGKSHCE